MSKVSAQPADPGAYTAPIDYNSIVSTTDCIKTVGLDGRLLGMNPEGQCLMEIDDFSMVEGKQWSSLWPEPHQATLEAAIAQAATGCVARFSADCPTAKGKPKYWDVVVSPIHNEAGEIVRLLSISRDVTREMHIAGERDLVTRELEHRVKNLFAVMDGLIRMSARAEPLAASFAAALRARLSGLGRAISYVYKDHKNHTDANPGPNPTFHALLNELLQPYQQSLADGSAITVTGEDQALSKDVVTSLALVITELATNALKYGALAQTGSLEIATTLKNGAYEIRWREYGAGAVAQPARTGFGSTLVDRIVTQQLHGAIARDWAASGLSIVVTIPVVRLSASET